MIDFNASEIVILAVLAVVIFGPDKLPALARKAARVLNYIRNIANDAQGKLRAELGPEFSELNFSDLNPKALVTSTLLDPVKGEVTSVAQTVNSAIADHQQADSAQPEMHPVVAFDPEAT